MTYKGRVRNGVIVLDEGTLPEGTPVKVEPAQKPRRATQAERLKGFIGIANDLPGDLAENHDHYLYGVPKKKKKKK